MTTSYERLNMNQETLSALPGLRDCFFNFLIARTLSNGDLAQALSADCCYAAKHCFSRVRSKEEARLTAMLVQNTLITDDEWIIKRANQYLRDGYGASYRCIDEDHIEEFNVLLRNTCYDMVELLSKVG